MFILLLYSPNKGKSLAYFCVNLPIHVEELLRQLAVAKRLLKQLMDLAIDRCELLPPIQLGDLLRQYMNSWLLQNRSRSLYLVPVYLVFLREMIYQELVGPAPHQKVLFNFLRGKLLRLYNLSIRKPKVKATPPNQVLYYHHFLRDSRFATYNK